MAETTATHASHDVLSGTAGWIALAVYVAGFIVTARIVFTRCDGYDRFEDRLGSVCLGIFWPVVLAFAAVCGLLALPTLGARTKLDRRERAAALERKVRERDRRIAQLEREAGIQP